MTDTLAIADELARAGTPFHLKGTSIGSSIACGLAARHPERVRSLVAINIPHPSAIREVMAASPATAGDQGERFSYFREAAKDGNERVMFEGMLEVRACPPRRVSRIVARSTAARRCVPSSTGIGPSGCGPARSPRL